MLFIAENPVSWFILLWRFVLMLFIAENPVSWFILLWRFVLMLFIAENSASQARFPVGYGKRHSSLSTCWVWKTTCFFEYLLGMENDMLLRVPVGYGKRHASSSTCWVWKTTCFFEYLLGMENDMLLRLQGEGRPLVAMGNGSALLVRGYVPQYQGLVGTIVTIARQEGPRHVMSFAYRSLYNGLSAGLQRQMCFASVRLGLYDTFKNIYQQLIDGNTRSGGLHIGTRVAAGITTGALAVLIAQPTDVVKVRFQAQKRTSGVKRYTSTIAAYRMIGREEGLAGLWKGILDMTNHISISADFNS
uniref:(California timema) hypothetical protein n=1 Tax=Timema californicum TaxID=61474 RepID=A0A7R9P6H0_TIMCA|nr:unnamed protein product [Timema californicum]